MAYIRKTTNKGKTYYQLVESYREDGKVKQRILKHLGTTKPDYSPDDLNGQTKLDLIKTLSSPTLPNRQYDIILADPPWQYHHREKDKTHRGRTPYPTMTDKQILKLNVGAIANNDCYLFLWTTKDHLQLAFECLDKWGFTFKNLITWVKVAKSGKIRFGVGHWGRNCSEFILLATKGKPKSMSALGITGLPSVFMSEVGGHSVKPVIPLLEALCDKLPGARKIELFARNTRVGWDIWGNEI